MEFAIGGDDGLADDDDNGGVIIGDPGVNNFSP